MGLWNDQIKSYRSLLSKMMVGAHWYGPSIFSKMYGHIGGADGDNNEYPRSVPFGAAQAKLLSPTFRPIEVLTDFNKFGGWDMDVPVHYPLTEEAIYGDNEAKGRGEQKKMAHAKVYVNQVTKVFKQSTGVMGDVALQNESIIKKLLKNYQLDIIDYHQKWQGYAPYDAVTRGYSRNVLASTADGGFALSQKSHPNFYAAGHGKATWSDTAATYETNVKTALESLSDTESDRFSTATIENMIASASGLKILPAKLGTDDMEYYVIIIHPMQALQLKRDNKWYESQKDAGPRDPKVNALFTGKIEGIYSNALILIDQWIPGAKIAGDTDTSVFGEAYDSTRGTVNYGNKNPIANPSDLSPRKLTVLLGASAVACGQAKKLQFESELDDFKRKTEHAGFSVLGYSRADIFDQDGYFGTKGNFKENTSSLIAATWSPSQLAW